MRDVQGEPQPTVADLGEDELLAQVFPILAAAGVSADVRVGPGDDAAVLGLAGPAGRLDLVATTDAMVRGSDWRDAWSSGVDVGAKVAAQNLADVAAMGARPVALLVTLVMESTTPVAWVLDLAEGLALAARQAGCAVVGGDLSSAPEGTLVVSVTALGSLEGRAPVLRSGAQAGDVIAVAGTLGLAAAGLRLLQEGRPEALPEAVARQRRPQPPLDRGPAAAAAGATSMVDLSDGLLRDAGRVARASGVCLDLAAATLAPDVERLAPALGDAGARDCVLAGGEEHSLLATFPPGTPLPDGFRLLGRVVTGAGVTLDGIPQEARGWDHFAG
ncbi:MAG: thiamine-phosphate kinase [Lapillicoccus sp.]